MEEESPQLPPPELPPRELPPPTPIPEEKDFSDFMKPYSLVRSSPFVQQQQQQQQVQTHPPPLQQKPLAPPSHKAQKKRLPPKPIIIAHGNMMPIVEEEDNKHTDNRLPELPPRKSVETLVSNYNTFLNEANAFPPPKPPKKLESEIGRARAKTDSGLPPGLPPRNRPALRSRHSDSSIEISSTTSLNIDPPSLPPRKKK